VALVDAIRAGVTAAQSILANGGLLASVTHETPSAVNGYNEPTGYAQTTRVAIIDARPRVVRDGNGVEVVAAATILFFADVPVTYQDRFTASGVTFARVLRVDKGVTPDSGGAFVTEVALG